MFRINAFSKNFDDTFPQIISAYALPQPIDNKLDTIVHSSIPSPRRGKIINRNIGNFLDRNHIVVTCRDKWRIE